MPGPAPGPAPGTARRAYCGPEILREGFRPFFLLAALWSATALTIWLLALGGVWIVPSRFEPMAWHSHEMIYGYGSAVVAGFLLTAIPNWTGRLPVRGRPLGMLVLIWGLGRGLLLFSQYLDPLTVALGDFAFLAVFEVLVLREIVAGRNWRNLPIAVAPLVLLGGNALAHSESAGLLQSNGRGDRVGLALLVLLICLVGGRIVPSFTRNWLAKRGAERLPAPFGLPDKIALLVTAATLIAWIAVPQEPWCAALSFAAALMNGWRVARWRGHDTLSEPLVWILHLGFGWIAAGFTFLGLVQAGAPLAASLPVHAFAAGAVGTMTLAVMTRASLGHGGRPLTAGPATVTIYLLVIAAAAGRIAAGLFDSGGGALLAVSAIAWIAAFGLFAGAYLPILAGRRGASVN